MTYIDFSIDLLDVWGEGRIDDNGFITGFGQAYNINKWNQKISNGPDRGKDIPNLLSVDDYDNPVFPIQDGMVNYITLMGAPLTEGTAQEMYRVLNKTQGVAILYAPSEEYKRIFERHARGFVYKPDEPLGAPFNEIKISPAYIYGVRGVIKHIEL